MLKMNNLRKEIDEIDAQLVRLFEKRMDIAKKIGLFKRENKLPLLDEKREKELLAAKAGQLQKKEFTPYLKRFFEELFYISKAYQFNSTFDKNVVLIGMMGSGKTLKGKLLAEKLCMKFADIDEEIEKEQKMSISEIFKEKDADFFRNLEKEKVCEFSEKKGYVISTGGGVVLDNQNMLLLKQNGVIIFLNRGIDEIATTIDIKNRPLLKNGLQNLYDIFNERLSLYKKWCDIEITGDFKTIDDAVNEIAKQIFMLG